jgi:hypothetical protein
MSSPREQKVLRMEKKPPKDLGRGDYSGVRVSSGGSLCADSDERSLAEFLPHLLKRLPHF